MLDLVLVGGGLANGLIAWRLLMTRPDVSFALIEAQPTLGGSHTWTFEGTDVTKEQLEWLWVLCTRSWPSHDLTVGSRSLRIGGGYHVISAPDFHAKLFERLRDRLRLRARATEVGATQVTLASGEVLEAKAVIDGRGTTPGRLIGNLMHAGFEVELDRAHGLEVPLSLDQRVEQRGEFTYVSVLPVSEQRVLIEEHSYTREDTIDAAGVQARLTAYLAGRQLQVVKVARETATVLPLQLGAAAPTFASPTVGTAAGLFNATTGASLSMAVELADALCRQPSFDAAVLTSWLAAHAREHWARQAGYRWFNRRLFDEPGNQALINRFFSRRMSLLDRLRMALARG